MEPVQIKMARAALDFTIDQLATAAGASHAEIIGLESGVSVGPDIAGKVQAALELAGIELIDSDGVRFRGRSAGVIPVENLNSANDE